MPCSKDMAVKLGISASRVVGHKGKLGVNRAGGGQRDPMQSMGHQERLHMKEDSMQRNRFKQADTGPLMTARTNNTTYSFILVIHFHPFDGELDGYRSPPPAALAKDNCGWITHKAVGSCSLDPKLGNGNNYSQRRRSPIIPSKQELSVLNPSTSVFFGVFDVPPLQTCGD